MQVETEFDSDYRKVLVAARRARQLQGGTHPLVSSHSTKFCRIAQDEIRAGKIGYIKKNAPVVPPLLDETGLPIMA